MYNIEVLRKHGITVDYVCTYAELWRICDVFTIGHNGHFTHFLIIIGAPGIGKSTYFEKAAGCAYFRGEVSPVGLYELAFRHKDEPLIIDDADNILTDDKVVNLLKVFMNDREKKKLDWAKQNSALEKAGIPKQFETKSRLCIIVNELPRITDLNNKAVLDRAKLVVFEPTVQEVHKYVGTWFAEKDVYDFIGNNLFRVTHPHCRWYTKALDEKRSNADWRKWLLTQWADKDENPYLPVIASILNSHAAGREQVQAWRKMTGLNRSLFYLEKKKYLAIQGPQPAASKEVPLMATNPWTGGLSSVQGSKAVSGGKASKTSTARPAMGVDLTAIALTGPVHESTKKVNGGAYRSFQKVRLHRSA
ncbi:MAG TPA: hypothetical protein VKX17_07000 [Planctomycetota bacterium]|nr:hypothetical protein [Planctomycetota bacterium]